MTISYIVNRIIDLLRIERNLIKMQIELQLQQVVRKSPPNDEYQRGYVEALVWTWQSAGWPDTPTVMAARALARAPYVNLN